MELTQIGGHTPSADPTVLSPALHTRTVHAIVVLPDGFSAISSAEDASMLRWSIETGEILERLEGHHGPVNHLCLRDGWLASAGDDRTVRVWRIGARVEPHFILGGHGHYVRQVALTDRHVVSVCQDTRVRVFDLEDGRMLHELEGHGQSIQSLGVSPDGRLAVTASLDHAVYVWDLDTGERLDPLYDANATVADLGLGSLYFATQNRTGRGHVAQTPADIRFLDHDQLLTSSDGAILWDLPSRSELRRLDDLAWPIQAVATDRRRLFLATHTEIRGVALDSWGDIVFRHAAPERGARSLALAGDRLIVGGKDGTVQVLDTSHWAPEDRHLSHAREATVAASVGAAATIDHDNVVRLWDLQTGACRATFDQHPEPNTKPFAFSPSGRVLALTRREGPPAVSLWNTADGSSLGQLDHRDAGGERFAVHAVLFAWDGVLVGPSGDGAIQWWSLDGSRTEPLRASTRQVSALALSSQILISQGYFPAPGTRDSVSQLQAWDLWRRELLWTRAAVKPEGERWAPSFGELTVLRDGRLLTGTGRRSGQLALYDVQTGEIAVQWDLGRWIGPTAQAAQTLVVVAYDHDTQQRELIHLGLGGAIAARIELPSGASRFTLAPGADRMAWAEQQTVVVARLSTGAPLARHTLAAETGISSLALDPRGSRLVVGGHSGRVTVLACTGDG